MFVKSYCASCVTCKHGKSPWHKPYGFLKPLPTPPHPWDSVSIDFIEQLPPSSSFTTIIVVVDCLLKVYSFLPSTPLTWSSLCSCSSCMSIQNTEFLIMSPPITVQSSFLTSPMHSARHLICVCTSPVSLPPDSQHYQQINTIRTVLDAELHY